MLFENEETGSPMDYDTHLTSELTGADFIQTENFHIGRH